LINCCFLTDGADVLYNKFNVDDWSPPDNPPQHPNSDYSCVVATTGQWRVSHCDEQHRVVCRSNLPGIVTNCLQEVVGLRRSHVVLACYGVGLVISRLRVVHCWVITWIGDRVWAGKPSRYVTGNLG